MAGIAHSVNIIDGFNGLSAGGVVIMLAAFGVVALHAGDAELAALALLIGAAVAGFLLVNFPRGPVIMGDGGAYLVGFLLAAVGVMLPQRNPEVSPWIVLVVLGYPVSETLYSILRKTLRKGDGPGRADKAHLHHLIYRYLRRALHGSRSRNAGSAGPHRGRAGGAVRGDPRRGDLHDSALAPDAASAWLDTSVPGRRFREWKRRTIYGTFPR